MNWALEELQKLVNAQTVMHVRQRRGSARAVSAARHEPTSGKLFAKPPRSYVNTVLGENLYTASVGTVWFFSDQDADSETRAHLADLEIVDLAVIPLENSARYSDYLEIQFSSTVARHDRTLLELLGPMIVEAWQTRLPGSVAAMLRGRPTTVARRQDRSVDMPILDPGNPAGLTRSEFRICTLIYEGRLFEDIARNLNVKRSTVRSHLRSIYSKAGVSGQVELVHRLHGVKAPDRALA